MEIISIRPVESYIVAVDCLYGHVKVEVLKLDDGKYRASYRLHNGSGDSVENAVKDLARYCF